MRSTRLRFTNLILTSGGDQNSAVIDASKVLLFNIDFYKIFIPSLGRNQTFEFQRACAHVGREVRFLLLASGGAQYLDRFEGSIETPQKHFRVNSYFKRTEISILFMIHYINSLEFLIFYWFCSTFCSSTSGLKFPANG